MGFPVTINGNTYNESDFTGYGYKTALPSMINDTASAVSAAASSASSSSSSATLSSQWATLTSGIVNSTDYSSKAWAVGGTGVTNTSDKGASKEWAVKTTGTVDTVDYSAKEWSVGTQIRGVSGKGSAKDWATYTSGTVDGAEYSAKYYANLAASSYDSFDDRYLGPKAVAPTVDNDGNPLVTGALYFHTAGINPGFRVWDGAQWLEPSGSISPDFNILREVHTATAGQTVFNLANSYTVGTNAIMVYQNGSRLMNADYTETDADTITLTTGATVGDELLFEIGVAVLGTANTATNIAFTPTGNIAATNVQTALAELDTEKQAALVSGTSIKTINSISLLGSGDIAVGAAVSRSARTSNTILGTADKGKFIDITSGTFTQTFTAAATLGDGWFCYVGNSGTGFVTLDPNSTETITREGVAHTTWVLWPQEVCLLVCNGTGFYYTNLQKGEITQTVSTSVASVSFSTGFAYRKKFALSWSEIDLSADNQVTLYLGTNTSATHSAHIRFDGTTVVSGVGTTDNFSLSNSVDGVPPSSTFAMRGSGVFSVNQTSTEFFGNSWYYGASSRHFGVLQSFWSGTGESSITGVTIKPSSATIDSGTFTVKEL